MTYSHLRREIQNIFRMILLKKSKDERKISYVSFSEYKAAVGIEVLEAILLQAHIIIGIHAVHSDNADPFHPLKQSLDYIAAYKTGRSCHQYSHIPNLF